MRNRKKKGHTDDTGNKPEPKTNATLSEVIEETKDVPVKEDSKPKKRSCLRTCAWILVKIVLFLVAFLVLAVLFTIFVLPRIQSELQVLVYLSVNFI